MPGERDDVGVAGGLRGWARRWWRPLAAELLGTALLVLVGVASLMPAEVSPASRVPAEVSPASRVPAEGGPASLVPAEGGPASRVPAEGGPASLVPAEGGPASLVPAEGGPASRVPAEGGPASRGPAKVGAAPPAAQPAFAFGGAVLVLVEAVGPVSGAHLNPAVSLAALLAGRLPAAAAAAYALAQLAGALLGAGALQLLAPAGPRGVVGVTRPLGVGAGAAAALEALLTAMLALLCCAAWAVPAGRAPDPALSLKFGLTIAALVFAGGSLTGASLNPARSFAPALLQNSYQDHWVYWVGPLGGAAAAALLHRFVLQPPPPAPPAAPEALPLHDKRGR